jgi:hypothetical protein
VVRLQVSQLLLNARHVLAKVVDLVKRPGVQIGLHVLSIAAVLATLALYGAAWLDFNWEMLTNPELQTDDARTSIFPFHRYASDPSLVEDPIATEMLNLVPIGIRFLYRIFVPFTDVFVAPKIVQAVAFSILVAAAVLLAHGRRAGLGAGVLLLFFVLHDWFAVERVAGGLPRAFGFPCVALWLAGGLGNY